MAEIFVITSAKSFWGQSQISDKKCIGNCDHPLCVVRPSVRPSVRRQLLTSSRESMQEFEIISQKIPYVKLYQTCSKCLASLPNMAARAKNRNTFTDFLSRTNACILK